MMRDKHKFLVSSMAKVIPATGAAILLLTLRGAYAGNLTVVVKEASIGTSLSHVKLRLPALQRQAASGPHGKHRFRNLPGGTYTLVTTYDGFKPIRRRIYVPQQGERRATIALSSESLRLGKLQVTGSRISNVAVDTKRLAPNILDERTAAQIRRLPDQNLASALKRLPAVSIEREEGRDRYVTIRGVKPELDNVTLNGNTLLTPDIYGRSGRAWHKRVVA